MQRLAEIGYSAEKVAKCANDFSNQEHEQFDEDDTNYLIDVYLAVLGRS